MTKKISLLFILAVTFCFSGYSWAYDAVVLMSAGIKPYNEALEGFRSACGCNVQTLTANEMERSEITDEILRLRPDVVVAVGMDALEQVRAIKDLPVVYVMVPGSMSTNRDESNISGVSMNISPAKYFDAMTKLFPAAERVGLIYDPGSLDTYVKDAIRSAAARGIRLVVKKAGTPDVVPHLMDSLKDKIDIFWMLPEADLLNSAALDYMLLFSFENKIPIFSFSKNYVDMGAAAAITVEPFRMGEQAGVIARKLQGESVSRQIRVDADVAGLIVNRKVMEKLGIKLDKKTANGAKDAG